MLVVIAGGHGKIALLLTEALDQRGDHVRALIRNPDHREDVIEAGAEPVLCDLESEGVDRVAEAVGEADAVVFAAGAGPGSGAGRKDSMDYGGAVKLMEAAAENGIDRYVMVSAISADPNHEGDEVYDVYVRAKGRADDRLVASDLAYTIVRPGRLTDEPATGRVSATPPGEGEYGEIPRADVAAVLAAVLGDRSSVGKTFDVVSGDTGIEAAIASL
ncbi:MAG: SDR family oxidoreductase [Solirubrobacterales bacterium]|nr:SDR family oxidoreductase [Solirubrobacterales bacterium]